MLALEGLEPLALPAPFLITERLYLWCGAWPVNNFSLVSVSGFGRGVELYILLDFTGLRSVGAAISDHGGCVGFGGPNQSTTTRDSSSPPTSDGRGRRGVWERLVISRVLPMRSTWVWTLLPMYSIHTRKKQYIYVWYTVIAKTIRLW